MQMLRKQSPHPFATLHSKDSFLHLPSLFEKMCVTGVYWMPAPKYTVYCRTRSNVFYHDIVCTKLSNNICNYVSSPKTKHIIATAILDLVGNVLSEFWVELSFRIFKAWPTHIYTHTETHTGTYILTLRSGSLSLLNGVY